MKRIFTIFTFYILLTSFILLTADVIKNPTQYDTVAMYHATIESR
jgi:hypothetical protein